MDSDLSAQYPVYSTVCIAELSELSLQVRRILHGARSSPFHIANMSDDAGRNRDGRDTSEGRDRGRVLIDRVGSVGSESFLAERKYGVCGMQYSVFACNTSYGILHTVYAQLR